MRVYIIGNDGITLCREPPAAANEGEIVVASNEELHAAQLSGKRLLALWNALPGSADADHTHALVAEQCHSIPDNLVALLGRIRAWHCSTETEDPSA